ncbi:hypothetical protein BN1723_019072 [Verticillium longisporum]|uniref:Ribosome production factor 2 homolog n=2 Tax=Verticillium longisporum TaxID=100787 RepID=A0A0G4N8V8_VERLO|nr:hypothetical protein BN1723_019072 [Verticillium longisporum]
MLRQVKPRNARSKRALADREPKVVENPKRLMALKGSTCSQVVQDALSNLCIMREPLVKKLTKKNEIHPFEKADSLEFLGEKNQSSLVMFGFHSKKRPHTITFARLFAHKVLDMLEMHLDVDTFRQLEQFKGAKFAVGQRPMVVFSGTAWDSPVANEYTMAKSMWTDFFKGEPSDKVDVEGLRYLVSLSVEEEGLAGAKPPMRLRVYTIRTRRSGQRLPRVEVDEIGPRMDFRVGRMQQPEEAMLKEAMRRPKTTEERTKKNIKTDEIGDKVGRVHTGRQDLSQLQTRRMKGLKRSRDVADDDAASDDEVKTDKRKKN